eukprot:scaffold16798_cov73-Isochrysis_galbana.AAC.1
MQLRRPRHVRHAAAPPRGIPGRDTGGRGGGVLDDKGAPPGVPSHEGWLAGHGLGVWGGEGAQLRLGQSTGAGV